MTLSIVDIDKQLLSRVCWYHGAVVKLEAVSVSAGERRQGAGVCEAVASAVAWVSEYVTYM